MAIRKPISEYTNDELMQVMAGKDPFAAPSQESGLVRSTLGNTAIDLTRGIAGLARSGVGLANIATGGLAGQAADALGRSIGLDYETYDKGLRTLYTPERQAKLQAVEQAKGAGDTFRAVMDNPSTILSYGVQSLPYLAGSGIAAGRAATGAIARGLSRGEAAARAGRAATATEGVLTAGNVAEEVRNEGGSYTDILKSAVPAGVATTVAGQFAGKLTGGPLEAVLTRRATGANMPTVGRIGGAALGATVEGAEEVAQSVSEQMFTNFGQGKDLTEGVGKAAVLGGIVGAPLGAVLGGISPQAVSVDASTGKPVDPLGDQREVFTRELNALKEVYFNDVARGMPEAEARAQYQQFAQVLKDRLIAGIAVPEAVTDVPAATDQATTADATPDTAPLGEDLIPVDMQEEDVYPPAAPVLEALDTPDGIGLANQIAISAADPEQMLNVRNAVLMALTEMGAEPEYISRVTEILDNPATAVDNAELLEPAVKAMQDTTEKFYDQLAQTLTEANPELADQIASQDTSTPDISLQEEASQIPSLTGQASSVDMAGDTQTAGKFAKGRGMRAAAAQRKANGQLTAKEATAAAKREASNYKGKQVIVGGKAGVVKSTPFGKVRVDFGNGDIRTVAPADVKAAPPKADKPAKSRARKLSPAIEKAAKAAADALDVTKLLAVPREARATLGKKLADATARAILGDEAQVMRNDKGEESKAGTIFVKRVRDASQRIVVLSRRLDKLAAKVSPRLTESLVNVQKLRTEANALVADIAAKPKNADAVLQKYRELRKSLESIRGGRMPDEAAEAFRAELVAIRDTMPKRTAKNVLRLSDIKSSVNELASFLNSNPNTGKFITGMVFEEADGTKLSELNDLLAKEIEKLLQLLGGRKTDAKSMAVAKANLDKIIGVYKTAKRAATMQDYETLNALQDEANDSDEFGAYDSEAADVANIIKEREKYDIMLSMAWAAYKDGRISKLQNRSTGRTNAPLSFVSDRVVRDALETGVGEDASQSPLAKVYAEGFVYNKDNPEQATPPGTRAVLSFFAQSGTSPMTKTLANMLKEVLSARIPSKTNPNPANPVHMLFLSPEQAQTFGVQSARWVTAQGLQVLREQHPELPADGELVMVARATPETIMHELFHATTANWVRSALTKGQIARIKDPAARAAAQAKRDTVDRLHKQLQIAIAEADKLAKNGVPEGSKLSAVVQTLQSIDAAGNKPGLSQSAAQANRVAEFISYAMTRATFQEFLAGINPDADAMASIEYTPAEQTLLEKLGAVFKAFLETVRVMLGLKPESSTTPARFERNRRFMTYLVNRVMLINKRGMEDGVGTAVNADSLDHTAAMNLNADQVVAARASLPEKRMNLFDRITSYPFRVLGAKYWGKDAKGIKNAEAAVGAKFQEFMKAHPNLAAVVGHFVEYVGVDKSVVAELKEYSQTRSAANYLGNRIEDMLRTMPKHEQATFMEALLDANKRAKLPQDQQALVVETERAIKELQKQASDIGGLAPSLRNASIAELIQYSVKRTELASKNFSAAPIGLGAQKLRAAVDKDNVEWHIDSQASSVFDEVYYPVYTKQDKSKPDAFVASTNTAMLKSMGADTSVPWRFEKVNKDGSVSFMRNMTYAEIAEQYPKLPVANFLANTLAVMSKAVASRQFIAHVLEINDGASDADKVLFESEADLEAAGVAASRIFEWKNEGRELPPALKLAARRPDSWVKLVGNRYGDLNGLYVNGAMFAAMQDMQSDQPFINSPTYNGVLRFWKAAKTRWSPGTHITNMMSNVVLSYMHDIPLSTVKQTATIYKKVMRKQPLSAAERELYDSFTASGAVLGNYSANELMRKQVEALTDFKTDGVSEKGGLWESAKHYMGYETEKAKFITKAFDAIERGAGTAAEKAAKINELTASLYENEDNVFRMAAFATERDRLRRAGMTDEAEIRKQAGAYAKYVMVDYEINAKGVNMLRQTALPFLAWTYRMVPMMVRIGYSKPWKVINVMTAMYAINALAYASIDGEDEDEERRKLDPYMRQRVWGIGPAAYIRMPWGDKDNPVFWGAGKYLPTGDMIATSENGAFGIPGWPQSLAPNGPAVSFIAAMMGYDSFQGRTMWNDANAWNQNAGESLKYLARQMAPVLPDKAIDAMLDDKKGLVGNDINHMYALSRYLGSRMYQVNMGEQEYKRGQDLKAMIQSHKQAIRKLARAEARLGNPDWDAVSKEQQEIAQRLFDRISEAQGTNE